MFRQTTDHPASSYGIPVWVDDAGNAYGSADKLSTAQAADFLSRSVQEVRRLARAGRLPHLREETPRGPVLWFSVSDLEAFQPQRRGRPEKNEKVPSE
jgi:hypothetical protein